MTNQDIGVKRNLILLDFVVDLFDFCAKRIPFSLTFSLALALFPSPLASAEDGAEGGDGADSQLQAAVDAHTVLEESGGTVPAVLGLGQGGK